MLKAHQYLDRVDLCGGGDNRRFVCAYLRWAVKLLTIKSAFFDNCSGGDCGGIARACLPARYGSGGCDGGECGGSGCGGGCFGTRNASELATITTCVVYTVKVIIRVALAEEKERCVIRRNVLNLDNDNAAEVRND